MGLLAGSPSWLRTPPPPLLFSPFDPCSPRSASPHSCRRPASRRSVFAICCGGNGKNRGDAASGRRAVLLVGFSVLPFLELRALAEDLVPQELQRRAYGSIDESIQKISMVQPTTFRRRAKATKQQFNEVKEGEQYTVGPDKEDSVVLEKEDVSSTPDKQDTIMLDQRSAITSDQQYVVQPEIQELKATVAEASSEDPNQFEPVGLQNAPTNPFLSLLSEFGIVASGVLAALYAISQKEKTATEAAVESIKNKLAGKEAEMTSLKENCEHMLRKEQEEKKKEMHKFKEAEISLLNRLASANETAAALRHEIQCERKLVEELRGRIGYLESSVAQKAADKRILEAKLKDKAVSFDELQDRVSLLSFEINDKEKNIESLKSLLSEKESECKKLRSNAENLKEELAVANSTIEELKVEMTGARAELSSKTTSIDSLNKEIQILCSEKDSALQRVQDLTKDYNDLKSSSDKRAALDAELLSKKHDQLQYLEEKLELALADVRSNDAVITELTREKDSMQACLDREAKNMKKLKDELQAAQQALKDSKLEASNLSKELDESKVSYKKLMSEISKIQDGYNEMESLLTRAKEEAKSCSKQLADELVSVKEDLRRTKEELDTTSKELKDVILERDNLKEELVGTYKKLENIAKEVKEERKLASILKKEFEVLEQKTQRDSEARRALEADLDEATKSLDEMNKSALLLSGELESSHSRTADLEAEKEILVRSLREQKIAAKEARETLEDCQNLIMRLGSERENLEKRAKKLEEDLSSAKGEILRLRQETNMKKEPVNEHQAEPNEVAAGTSFTSRRTTSRRRKRGST